MCNIAIYLERLDRNLLAIEIKNVYTFDNVYTIIATKVRGFLK